MAAGWKAFQANLNNIGRSIDFSSAGDRFSRSVSTLSQQIRESTGNIDDDGVTQLPEQYKMLEQRVDALKSAHTILLRVAKTYENQGYDYPAQINESVSEASQTIGYALTTWASAATKGTSLPQISPSEKAPEQPKTLSHALSRAAAGAALDLSGDESPQERLARALQTYAVAQNDIGNVRLEQDAAICEQFVRPWSATLNTQINAAMRSRNRVKNARLFLDTCRSRQRGATSGPRQEQLRLETEAAEEDLVNATEEAIKLMREVLDNPEPLRNMAALVKAQQVYHASAAETLAGILGDLEENAVLAESDARDARK